MRQVLVSSTGSLVIHGLKGGVPWLLVIHCCTTARVELESGTMRNHLCDKGVACASSFFPYSSLLLLIDYNIRSMNLGKRETRILHPLLI